MSNNSAYMSAGGAGAKGASFLMALAMTLPVAVGRLHGNRYDNLKYVYGVDALHKHAATLHVSYVKPVQNLSTSEELD